MDALGMGLIGWHGQGKEVWGMHLLLWGAEDIPGRGRPVLSLALRTVSVAFPPVR